MTVDQFEADTGTKVAPRQRAIVQSIIDGSELLVTSGRGAGRTRASGLAGKVMDWLDTLYTADPVC